jgi:hypothetical protein
MICRRGPAFCRGRHYYSRGNGSSPFSCCLEWQPRHATNLTIPQMVIGAYLISPLSHCFQVYHGTPLRLPSGSTAYCIGPKSHTVDVPQSIKDTLRTFRFKRRNAGSAALIVKINKQKYACGVVSLEVVLISPNKTDHGGSRAVRRN